MASRDEESATRRKPGVNWSNIMKMQELEAYLGGFSELVKNPTYLKFCWVGFSGPAGKLHSAGEARPRPSPARPKALAPQDFSGAVIDNITRPLVPVTVMTPSWAAALAPLPDSLPSSRES
ncbi:hypothetical protein B0H12DRAFT_1146156 [Mycena haematopus]|nr:hypothetical protein B0H12DRAFT_1146156 [Mycena haematopus]